MGFQSSQIRLFSCFLVYISAFLAYISVSLAYNSASQIWKAKSRVCAPNRNNVDCVQSIKSQQNVVYIPKKGTQFVQFCTMFSGNVFVFALFVHILLSFFCICRKKEQDPTLKDYILALPFTVLLYQQLFIEGILAESSGINVVHVLEI